jgi:hypothetical protein
LARRPDQRAFRRRGLRFDQQYAYAVWDRKANRDRAPDGYPSQWKHEGPFSQYHQLSVWANIQNTLDFFESGFGLGRRISWAFEANRLSHMHDDVPRETGENAHQG